MREPCVPLGCSQPDLFSWPQHAHQTCLSCTLDPLAVRIRHALDIHSLQYAYNSLRYACKINLHALNIHSTCHARRILNLFCSFECAFHLVEMSSLCAQHCFSCLYNTRAPILHAFAMCSQYFSMHSRCPSMC